MEPTRPHGPTLMSLPDETLMNVLDFLLPNECIIAYASPGETLSKAVLSLLQTNHHLHRLGKSAICSKFKRTPLVLSFTTPPPMNAASQEISRSERLENFLRQYGDCFTHVLMTSYFSSISKRSFDWFPNMQYLEIHHPHWRKSIKPQEIAEGVVLNKNYVVDLLNEQWSSDGQTQPLKVIQSFQDREGGGRSYDIGIKVLIDVEESSRPDVVSVDFTQWAGVVVEGNEVKLTRVKRGLGLRLAGFPDFSVTPQRSSHPRGLAVMLENRDRYLRERALRNANAG